MYNLQISFSIKIHKSGYFYINFYKLGTQVSWHDFSNCNGDLRENIHFSKKD